MQEETLRNRFKSKMQAAQIRDLMTMDIAVMQETVMLQPRPDVRISTEALLIFQRGRATGTGF